LFVNLLGSGAVKDQKCMELELLIWRRDLLFQWTCSEGTMLEPIGLPFPIEEFDTCMLGVNPEGVVD
jgi:hypothetical protein